MQSTIIQIGNSRGIRIPKVMLQESGIDKNIEIKIVHDGLKITPQKEPKKILSETTLLSQKVLTRDWDNAEEDKAWINL